MKYSNVLTELVLGSNSLVTLLLSVAVASRRLLMLHISKRRLLLPKEVDEEQKIFIISHSDSNTDDRHNRQV